jgi:hypothetical protein
MFFIISEATNNRKRILPERVTKGAAILEEQPLLKGMPDGGGCQ